VESAPQVDIHGAAAVHEHITGVAGSHARAVATLTPATFVHTTITRSNFRELSALAGWLHAQGIRRWRLHMAQATGRFAADPRPWLPRLGMAVPHALAAIDRARRLGMVAELAAVPRCLVGPHDAWLDRGPARAFGERCEQCAVRSTCDGVDAWYLARFGERELRPLTGTET
jgi:hypothetical protein